MAPIVKDTSIGDLSLYGNRFNIFILHLNLILIQAVYTTYTLYKSVGLLSERFL